MGGRSSGLSRVLATVLGAGLLGAMAIVALPVAIVAIILPAAESSCTGASSLETSPVSVPPGLDALARELWDRPLSMQVGRWYPAGATEYHEGDSTGSGHYGSIGDPAQANLREHPDSFAELSLLQSNPANGGTFTFADANALGVLPYMSALRVARGGQSIVVYKRDIGYGQGPGAHTPEGFEYRLDLWGPAARALSVSEDTVDIELLPRTGSAQTLGLTDEAQTMGGGEEGGSGCAQAAQGEAAGPLALTASQTAQVLGNGLAAAPKDAPQAVKRMIAAGNRLYGTAYLYGGAHGPPLSELQGAYDCSSAVSYVLHAGGVFGEYAEDSTQLESYGDPGPGKWVSVYANSEHAFVYVAGLRFDTVEDPAYDSGPSAGKPGARWRVSSSVPNWAPWVVRHPRGL